MKKRRARLPRATSHHGAASKTMLNVMIDAISITSAAPWSMDVCARVIRDISGPMAAFFLPISSAMFSPIGLAALRRIRRLSPRDAGTAAWLTGLICQPGLDEGQHLLTIITSRVRRGPRDRRLDHLLDIASVRPACSAPLPQARVRHYRNLPSLCFGSILILPTEY